MPRYFTELAYNGTPYNGWQIQPDAPSVQQELNRAFSTLLRQEISLTGAGRTDTGVHAAFFVAHFDVLSPLMDISQTIYKLNRLTDKNIAIYTIYPVRPDAHARFSALSRTYKYFINKSKNPFTEDYAIRTYPLPQLQRMNEACRILFEYTDFTSFSKLHTDTKTNNCKILKAEWSDTGEQLVFTIQADRFLRNMVRAIVGTMLDVGQGKISLREFRDIIESRNRCKAGNSVPGKALFLWDVQYPEEIKI